ncbi:hypothetical protein HF086_011761 [Spodoptera exigua]|uniref:SAM domain-containing protein n=1 Tax=Spodoptera exigua TaxID=7107 RepID=A0A922MGS8_SPOEX|nr:hypothetical protein HF086_011761 [Spodoptera exigua]
MLLIPKTYNYRLKQSTIRHKITQKAATKNSGNRNIQQGENFDKDIATAESNIEKLKKVIERLERNDVIVTEIQENNDDNQNKVEANDKITEDDHFTEEKPVFKDAYVNLKRLLLQNYIVPANDNNCYNNSNELNDDPLNVYENTASNSNETTLEEPGKVIIEINTGNYKESAHNKITIKENDNASEKVVFKEAYVNLRRLLLDKYNTDDANINEDRTSNVDENIEANNNERAYSNKKVNKIKANETIDIGEREIITAQNLESTINNDTVVNDYDFTVAAKQEINGPLPGTSNEHRADDSKKENEGEVGAKKYVLTHVIDGFIVQESNHPFPIRKSFPKISTVPEKTSTESTTEDIKDEIEDEDENLNPFRRLQHSLVRSWTAAELSSHLLKFGWSDTASILSDNEIDGESLFMVSKNQLVLIGIEEDQAECIEEFLQGNP